MERSRIEMLLHSAKGFAETGFAEAKKINENLAYNEIWSIAPKAIVNMNFSAELFLKFIWFHYDIEGYSQIHYVDKLFKKTPEDIKSEIYNEFEIRRINRLGLTSVKLCFESNSRNIIDERNIDDLPLDDLLKLHSNSFVKWRYHFEYDQSSCIEYNFRLMFIFIQSIIAVLQKKGILVEPEK